MRTAPLLLALLLLVLPGMTGVAVARPGHGQDHLAPPTAGRGAVAPGIDTAAAVTADHPVRLQRIRRLVPAVQQTVTEVQAAVVLRPSRGFEAVRAVVLPDDGEVVAERIRAVHAEEVLGVAGADAASATGTTASSSIVVGLVGLLVAAGAAAAIGRPDRSRRVTARDGLGVDAAGSSAGISEAVDVITSMAQQAELLALDAAVEAARAGEAGTGSPTAASPVGVSGVPRAVASGTPAADVATMSAGSTLVATRPRALGYAAARSRAHGPTTALWHAVQLRRPDGGFDGPCELAVCGSLVRVSTEQRWPVTARGVCPACATLAH